MCEMSNVWCETSMTHQPKPDPINRSAAVDSSETDPVSPNSSETHLTESHTGAIDRNEYPEGASLATRRYRRRLTRSVQPEALAPIRIEEFLPALSRWTTFGSWFIVGVLGLGAVASTVVTYRTAVKATAMVRPAGEARLVQSGAEGAVTNILVKDYEIVEKGQVIAYIDSSRLQTLEAQLESSLIQAQGQLTQINAQLKSLEQQMNAEIRQAQQVVDAAKAELDRADRTYRDQQIVTMAEVQEAEAQLNLARQEVVSYRQLATDGTIARLQLANKEAALKTAEARLTKLQSRLNPTNADVMVAQAKIAQEQSRGTATLAQFNQSREQLVQQRLGVQNQLSHDRKELTQVRKELEYTTIRASVTGTLYNLRLRNVGQVLRPGDTIAQIIPRDAPLEIKAIIPSDQVNTVKLGQPTQMQVSACPFSVFGTLPGQVKSISPDAIPISSEDKNRSETPAAQITRPGYTVIVTLADRLLKSGQHTCELLPGAEGRLTIISREETVLSFLLRKIRLETDF